MSKIIEFPENWDELSPEQAQRVFELHLQHVSGNLSETDVKLILIHDWLSLGFKFNYDREFYKRKLSSDDLENQNAQLFRIMETMDWLYKHEEVEKRVNNKTKKVILKTLNYLSLENFFPEVKTDEGFFVAPSPFYIIEVGQYIKAFDHYRNYYESKNPEDLSLFFATLYLPERKDFNHIRSNPDWNGRRNERYNEHLTSYYMQLLEKVPQSVKYAALLWFMNWDQYLKTEEIEIEGKLIRLSALFKSGSSGGESLGLTGMLLSIAEEGTFGHIDDVMQRPLIDIYIKMYNSHLAIKNMKKK